MSTASTIQQYYNAFYGRPADPSGLAFWVAGVNGSGDLIGAALKVFGSASTPEFALRYPAGTSTSTFLDTAYGNMFNRTPDADGKRFWEAAFTNWVAGGKSEGEARALILQNFVDSANAQVGTADKLTITNKLTVADMMTASVKAYGTENVYLSKLDKAQGLLASVNASQASVDIALAKIKVGGIYETGETAPDPATIIDSYSRSGLLLNLTKNEIVKVDSPSDAAFTYTKGTTFNDGLALSISNFTPAADRIDISAFNLPSSSRVVASGAVPWRPGEFTTFDGSVPVGYKIYPGFFANAALIKVEIGAGAPWLRTELLIDANKNGNLDPELDVWISLSGVPGSAVDASIFIF
jgi:hypothetical protein